MTNFEEITKDIETLAKFLSLINNGECEHCIAQIECDKLIGTGDTIRRCVRSWCAYLNKEV